MSETTITGPHTRIRLNFTNTIKDGWRCSESTIEVEAELLLIDDQYQVRNAGETGVVSTQLIRHLLADLAAEAHHIGSEEANRRNRAEREALADVPMEEVPF